MLQELGTYISLMAKGDGDIILGSGFDVRRQPEPMPPLQRPLNFESRRGEHEGTADLEWKSVRGAIAYLLEITTNYLESGGQHAPEYLFKLGAFLSKGAASSEIL